MTHTIGSLTNCWTINGPLINGEVCCEHRADADLVAGALDRLLSDGKRASANSRLEARVEELERRVRCHQLRIHDIRLEMLSKHPTPPEA